jgi:hypothetical protein
MTNASWAARMHVDADRVTLTFSSPVRCIGLSAGGARQLACKLLLLAESAENEHSRFRGADVPHDEAEQSRVFSHGGAAIQHQNGSTSV